MTKASVLVALAVMGVVPNASNAGKVSNVPPPATALMTPAPTAEPTKQIISKPDIIAKVYCVSTPAQADKKTGIAIIVKPSSG
jgi:hypothetical protein